MKKLFLAVLLIVISFNTLKADDFTDAMVKGKKNLQSAMNTLDEKALVKVRGEFERILQLKKQEWIVNYYIAVADYYLAFTSMGEKQDKEKLKKYTESGLSNLEKSILVRDDFADSYILKYALNFNRWIYEQDKMADIMQQSSEAKEKAEKLDPENPRLHLMDGMATFYMPEAFGGGAKKSTPIFEKSMESFNKRVEKEAYYPEWGKDLTYGFLAMSYTKRDDDGDKKKATDLYDKATKELPESSFLKVYIKKQLEELK
jgi:hypothetical protein